MKDWLVAKHDDGLEKIRSLELLVVLPFGRAFR
jgi:hypothetical protein